VEISFGVTFAALLLGYSVAYLMANIRQKHANILMILVLLPFWTSLLVRTYAWIVILQSEGVVNKVLTGVGLLDHSIMLVHNRIGVYVAMTHVLLPFMILPIYSVMRNIPETYAKAAAILGAKPWQVFWKVYFPQTLPGVAAGCMLVFILALGFFITPMLVGGPKDTMAAEMIAIAVNNLLNWHLGSALGTWLLVAILVLFFFSKRMVSIVKED
jgi:putative spermidine/putrescine transport system permease protein